MLIKAGGYRYIIHCWFGELSSGIKRQIRGKEITGEQNKMAIKNIVFDFGGVLLNWNPRYFYKNVFKDNSEMEYFLRDICGPEWIKKQDSGYSFSEATKELQSQHPEYRSEIEMYHKNWAFSQFI